MKTQLLAGLFIFIFIAFGLMLFRPGGVSDSDSTSDLSITDETDRVQQYHQVDERSDRLAEEERRIERMRAEYARLEMVRDSVRKQLGKLKARLWGLTLPVEQANEVTERMQQGHAALKDPLLLGAFHSTDDIRREIEKVENISAGLLEAESIILAAPPKM